MELIMYKKILAILLTLTLTACGGSSEKSKENEKPVQSINNAPTLSGLFTVDAKASQVTTVVLNTSDAENDALTFSVTEQPEWLNFSNENNQITLAIEPTFFDIEHYNLEFSISDGNKSTTYNFTVNIIDNPAQWQNITLTNTELLGTWVSDTNDSISFIFMGNGNQQGIYLANDEMTPFHWRTADSLELTLFEPGCIEECAEKDFYSIKVVAEKAERYRVVITDNRKQTTAYNLTKNNSPDTLHTKYINIPQTEYNKISTINYNEKMINITLPLGDISLGNTTYFNRTYTIESTINFIQDNYNVDMGTANKAIQVQNVTLFNSRTYDYVSLDFDIIVDSISLLPSSSGITIASISYHAELSNELDEGSLVDDFDGLKNTLEKEYKHSSVLQAVISSEAPSFIVGNSYTGRIINNVNIDLGGLNYNAGGSVFSITGETSGETSIKVAGTNYIKKIPFTWSVNNEVFTIQMDGKNSHHEFFTLPNGELSMTSQITTEEGVNFSQAYPFYQAPVDSFEISQYMGTFKHSVYNLHDSYTPMLLLNTSGHGKFYGSESDIDLTDYWKLEDDGSISMIANYSCSNSAYDYNTCYAEAKADDSRYFFIRNLKLLAIKNNIYKFEYSLSLVGEPYNWAYQSHRYFEKKSQ